MATESDLLQRIEGRVLFGSDPEGYEAGRPEYPDRVYEVLTERCGLRPGARVLEIGPGTGLVTRHLLGAGASVTTVEPDPGLAGYLSAAHPDVEVVGAPLEEAELPEAAFDLSIAATSFHWVDQQSGLAKLGRWVRPGGWVAVWWTLFRDPGHPDTFVEAVEGILGPSTRGAFDEPGRPPFQLDGEYRLRDLGRWAGLREFEIRADPCTLHALRPAGASPLCVHGHGPPPSGQRAGPPSGCHPRTGRRPVRRGGPTPIRHRDLHGPPTLRHRFWNSPDE